MHLYIFIGAFILNHLFLLEIYSPYPHMPHKGRNLAQLPGDSQETIVGGVNERALPTPTPHRRGDSLAQGLCTLFPCSLALIICPQLQPVASNGAVVGGPGPRAPWSCRQRRLPSQHRVSEAWPLSVSTDGRGCFRLCEVLSFEEASGCQRQVERVAYISRRGGSRGLP